MGISMELFVKSGEPHKFRTECIILGVYAKKKLSALSSKLDKQTGQSITKAIKLSNFTGLPGQHLLLHDIPKISAKKLLVVGLGEEKNQSIEHYHKALIQVVDLANKYLIKDALCLLTDTPLFTQKDTNLFRLTGQICHSHVYQFDLFKKHTKIALKKLYFWSADKSLTAAKKSLQQGSAIGEGMALTRDQANLPGNICTPTHLANVAKKLASGHRKMTCKVLEESQMKKLGMGSFLSVSQGSPQPGKMVFLEFKNGPKTQKPIVLVGKGITFDTGGNSLKPAASMVGMKYDMCGAATVLGVLKAASLLNLPLNIIGALACAENTPGGQASRPDDIVSSMSGQTIEILNTDAEGRLVLADTLTYIERYKPDTVIDMATLTGACVIALGHHRSAVFSNDDNLAKQLVAAGDRSTDLAWHMPLGQQYHEQLDSNVADMANIGGSTAGSITAACFLEKFVGNYKWAHMDIAGTAANFTGPKRTASGRPVPLLVEFLLSKLKT